MRRHLRPYLPNAETIGRHRWFAPFANNLLHPRLWHLNRHSVAGAIAIGLFCGLIPGPFQMPGAALACVALRVNLPLALLTTLYTNPLTILPLYFVAYRIGHWLLDSEGSFSAPPAYGESDGLGLWLGALLDWLAGLGSPLALGLFVLGSSLALCGYLVVRAVWRAWILHAWHRRKQRRRATGK